MESSKKDILIYFKILLYGILILSFATGKVVYCQENDV